jgi:Carboxypeptidase regulatory-like domain
MKRNLSRAGIVLAFILMSDIAFGFTLQGRLIDANTAIGISRLSVRLASQSPSTAANRVTLSNPGGQFVFRDVAPGYYILGVYQGTRRIYAETLSIQANTQREIALRRR